MIHRRAGRLNSNVDPEIGPTDVQQKQDDASKGATNSLRRRKGDGGAIIPSMFTKQRRQMLCVFLFLVTIIILFVIAMPSDSHNNVKTPPQVPPLHPPNLDKLSPQNKERFLAVREAIEHAWQAYKTIALLKGPPYGDDVNTLTGEPGFWLHHAATLFDSLDTLYLAGLTDEYNEAVELALSVGGINDAWKPTKIFEYSIRVTAGLLGAFSVSGDQRLLDAARESADAVLAGAFAWSPTALPRMYDVVASTKDKMPMAWIHRIYSFFYRWGRDVFTKEHRTNSLAGMGSFAVEYTFLSLATGDSRYRSKSNAIYQTVAQHRRSKDGMIPNIWNVMDGIPASPSVGFASGGDSFYEYLLKAPLLAGCNENGSNCDEVAKQMLALYHQVVDNSLPSNIIDANGKGYPVDNGRDFHHLLCFLPGLLALEGSSHLDLAKELADGCHATYRKSQIELGPEQAIVGRDGSARITDARYQLRPEHVESLFVLYRKTGDAVYQEMAWDVFSALTAHCRTLTGFSSLDDVNKPSSQTGEMPSYFLAETLKYLLLIFGPKDYVSLNDFVFTTEAHSLRKHAVAKE